MSGLNDLFLGRSAADIYDDLVEVCTALRAAGWQVVVCSPTAANQAYGAESRRLAYAALIRAGWTGFADEYVEVTQDEDIGVTGAELNSANFLDQIHMTGAGYAILAGLIYDRIVLLP